MAYGTVNADVIGTSVSGSNLGAGNASIIKNRVLNGACVIDQRNAGASTTGTTAVTYNIDRFASLVITDGVMTFQQVADAPNGFKYSLKATTTTADSSLSATQRAILLQRIEGYNVADLMLGSSSALTFTLSFWVKSTLTGTFGGSFQNNNSDRAYPFTYTISSANTWEQKTITITGDTTGTWNTTTGTGLQIVWGLGVGSTNSATAGSWQAGDYNSATGATSVIGTLNATWQVTGVQLEVGSSATGYEYRQYGQELALCQRYLPVINTSGAVGSFSTIANGYNSGSTTSAITYAFKVTPRTPPTGVTVTNPTTSFGVDQGGSLSISAIGYYGGTQDAGTIYATVSGATTGRGVALYAINGNGQIQFTGCEL